MCSYEGPDDKFSRLLWLNQTGSERRKVCVERVLVTFDSRGTVQSSEDPRMITICRCYQRDLWLRGRCADHGRLCSASRCPQQ
jgi:hypothetical protein